jgi:hypothetical protein
METSIVDRLRSSHSGWRQSAPANLKKPGWGRLTLYAQILHGQGAEMIEKSDGRDNNDYSCEIVSFIVLVILSALSHFWFIVVGTAVAIVFWAAIVLLGQLVRYTASTFPWRPRSKQIHIENTRVAAVRCSTRQNTPERGLLHRTM